jgi:hypothetical protein
MVEDLSVIARVFRAPQQIVAITSWCRNSRESRFHP